jgi:replicative DNA helicase
MTKTSKGTLSQVVKLDNLPVVHSAECERNVLAAMLSNPADCIDDAAEKLTREDFFNPCHQVLFSALLDMRNSGKPIDATTVYRYLADRHLADAAGGAAFLGELSASVIPSITLASHIESVRSKAVLRRMAQASAQNIVDCLERQHEADSVVVECEQRILAVGNKSIGSTIITPVDGLNRTFRAMEEVNAANGNGLRGPSTGFPEMDRMTKGFRPKGYSVVGARTNVGKSAIGLTFAYNMVTAGDPCGIFSLEMTVEAMWSRLLAMETDIDVEKIDSVRLSNSDYDKLAVASDKMKDWPLPIAQRRGATLAQVTATARRMVKRFGIKVFIVDYLQKIRVPGVKDKRLEVSAASEGLACLAEELNIHVLALAQLGRDVEKEDRYPRLSDLKESGDIEQDADFVALLHRKILDDDKMSLFGKLNIAKQRNGPTGIIPVVFNHRTTRFTQDTRSEIPDL